MKTEDEFFAKPEFKAEKFPYLNSGLKVGLVIGMLAGLAILKMFDNPSSSFFFGNIFYSFYMFFNGGGFFISSMVYDEVFASPFEFMFTWTAVVLAVAIPAGYGSVLVVLAKKYSGRWQGKLILVAGVVLYFAISIISYFFSVLMAVADR